LQKWEFQMQILGFTSRVENRVTSQEMIIPRRLYKCVDGKIAS